MNKTNKVIVVVVLALVVLFGVGQFFANSATPPAATQNETILDFHSVRAAPLPATQVIAYAAVQPASSTPMESGSCWTNSIAAPFRADAWRCTVGNSISDPCFQIAKSTSTLLCNMNPTVLDSTSTFVLKLTKPLPAPEVPPGHSRRPIGRGSSSSRRHALYAVHRHAAHHRERRCRKLRLRSRTARQQHHDLRRT